MGVFKRWIKSKDGKKTAYWYIRYMVNGEDKWESVGKVGLVTKAMAQAKLEERKRQVRLGQLDIIGTEIPTVAEFVNDYLSYIGEIKQNCSTRRSKQALNHFIRFFGDKRLSEISSKDIDTYKSRRIAVIKHLFNLARRWHKFFGDNPIYQSGMLEVNNPVERILTPEEEKRLLSVSPPYLRNIITIALNTGMR
ncbi:MAG: hypothetical protein KatS3mg078_2299 [Deltaproteobacteria bacterium]|nr:MAG: hypothetical protein KatS3mg078_2299 [Deltaproteobacteria bacterium]